jgi:hypothetical protein
MARRTAKNRWFVSVAVEKPGRVKAFVRSHDKIGFVSQKSGRLLPLRLWRLPKADTRSATILVDELDAGGDRRGVRSHDQEEMLPI